MNDGRMLHVNNFSKKFRKKTSMENNVLSKKLNVYTSSMNRHKTIEKHKRHMETIPMLKTYMDIKCVQKIMTMRKVKDDNNEEITKPIKRTDPFDMNGLFRKSKTIFGEYGGTTTVSIKPDIEKLISHNHPKNRKHRKVMRHLETGEDTGNLLALDRARTIMDELMERPFHPSRFNTPKRVRDCKLPQLVQSPRHTMHSSEETTQPSARTLRLPPVEVRKTFKNIKKAIERRTNPTHKIILNPDNNRSDETAINNVNETSIQSDRAVKTQYINIILNGSVPNKKHLIDNKVSNNENAISDPSKNSVQNDEHMTAKYIEGERSPQSGNEFSKNGERTPILHSTSPRKSQYSNHLSPTRRTSDSSHPRIGPRSQTNLILKSHSPTIHELDDDEQL
ncbi:unnamed protein product [Owenia fusiformis]|uniref:Uncharacterized protein n=1 Tax=Owenia fusiformis TaxID=6347 RepID=A0A8S4PFM5_OWEFU|nr:unnamed protein product [Owenia fusiformis]